MTKTPLPVAEFRDDDDDETNRRSAQLQITKKLKNVSVSQISSLLKPQTKHQNTKTNIGQISIKTYIPDSKSETTIKKIFELANKYYVTNAETNAILFCNDNTSTSSIFWPMCQLTGLFSENNAQEQKSDLDIKYLGIQCKNPLSPAMDENMLMTYTFYRESAPELSLTFSQVEIEKIIEQGIVFLNYLKGIHESVIAVGEGLPNIPEVQIIRKINDTTIISMYIDEPTNFRQITNRYSPTISIRMMKKDQAKNRWFYTRNGVTLASINFFYLIEAVLKNYVFRVKTWLVNMRDEYLSDLTKMHIFSVEDLSTTWTPKKRKNCADDDDDAVEEEESLGECNIVVLDGEEN